jgi:hypothetical protein
LKRANRILIVRSKIPFSGDGNESIAHTLVKMIALYGCNVDLIELPIDPKRNDFPIQVLGIRSLDLSMMPIGVIDLVITLDYPSCAVQHPRKTVWLQHDLSDPFAAWGAANSDLDTVDAASICATAAEHLKLYLAESQRVYTTTKKMYDQIITFDNVNVHGIITPPISRMISKADKAWGQVVKRLLT